VEPEQSLQLRIRECLTAIGISSPVEWDVLVFVCRHQASLANAEQISHMVGYPATLVHDALDNLESLKLLRRSKASNGMSLYRLVSSRTASPSYECFRTLMESIDNRAGRLEITKELRQGRKENRNG
jgi:hypothetical protein